MKKRARDVAAPRSGAAYRLAQRVGKLKESLVAS